MTGHLFGRVDDVLRCLLCEVMPHRAADVCPAAEPASARLYKAADHIAHDIDPVEYQAAMEDES